MKPSLPSNDVMLTEQRKINEYHRDNKVRALKALRFLEYLVQMKLENKFAAPGKPCTDSQLALQFYANRASEKLEKENKSQKLVETVRTQSKFTYLAYQDAANKLRGKVRALLGYYYENGPGKSAKFVIDIVDEKDRFEPFFRLRRSASSDLLESPLKQTQVSSGISIAAQWDRDETHELMRRSSEGTELRFQTTCLVSPGPMKNTIAHLLGKGVSVSMLMTDPACGVFEARYRIHEDRQYYDMKDEAERQHKMLIDLVRRYPESKFKLKLSDLMPFGFFVQGESEQDGKWMLIGLMPATKAYTEGPKITITPDEPRLWETFESTWQASWDASPDCFPEPER